MEWGWEFQALTVSATAGNETNLHWQSCKCYLSH